MEQQQSSANDEVDLNTIFSGIRKRYHDFLIWLYHGVRFILRMWVLVLGIIILGVLAGYIFKSEKQQQEATLIVQLNFDSANYVYEAIDQLNSKISENDTLFLQQTGLEKHGKVLLSHLKIEPIVNLNDLIPEEENSTTVGYLQTLFDKSKFKDDLLTSDILIPVYKKHRITLKSNVSKNSNVLINKLLSYLNDNSLVQEIKTVSIKSTKNHIEENKKSIAHIDSIAKAYGHLPRAVEGTSSMYFNLHELNNNNMHLLFKEKSKLLRKTENMQIELLKYDKIVKLLNKPKLHIPEKGFLSNKMIVYPIGFLIILFVIVQLLRLYHKAERLSRHAS